MNIFIIGISGGSGSGKSSIAQGLKDHFKSEMLIISHDNYYRDQSHLEMQDRLKVNYDHPDSLETELLVKHLRALQNGKSIHIPEYSFESYTRNPHASILLNPCPIILIEGILIFTHDELCSMMNLKVFVDVPADIRILRRTMRDIQERGRSLESCCDQYLQFTRPMHNQFVEPTKDSSDIVIPQGGFNNKAIKVLIDTIQVTRKSI